MKRLMATWLLGALFTTAFVAGKGTPAAPAYPDSLPSVWFYTEGIKQQTITGDTLRARKLFAEAIRRDSNYAPAYFELVSNGMYASPEEAIELAGRAYRLDTANKWYHQFYGQTLVFAGEYDLAVPVYRSLINRFPKEPDFYRILAALYEQTRQPAEAVALLDSAEVRFGRIPVLNSMKRRLLVATGQIGRALDEARQEAAATPYEPEPHVALANLYAADGRDSLARAEFDEALRIDSTNLATLMSLADYYTSRQDYRSLLAVSRRLFLADELPLETKIRQFEQYTSDIRFYREYYLQLNDLASVLAIKYPDDKRVVELYAGHLIASGELDQALALYKSHLDDQPPVEEYYRTIIDIESYKKRTDSVGRYVVKAIGLFPDRIDFRLAKGHVASLSGDYDRALGAYEESLAYASTDSLRSVVWGMIGDTWHLKASEGVTDWDERMDLGTVKPTAAFRKGMKRCYSAYERSLRYDPDNTMVLNNYAYFLSVEGRDLERALAMASRVVALEDDNPTYLDTHAWVLHKLGRTDEAKKIQQRAVVLDGQKSPSLLAHYGDILHALGEQFMAEIYWRQALEKGYDPALIEPRLKQPAADRNSEKTSR